MATTAKPTGSLGALASLAGGKMPEGVDGPAHEDTQFRDLLGGVPTIESVVAADTAAKGADHAR